MWRNYYNDLLNSNSSYNSSNNNIKFEKINDLSYMSDFMSTPCNVQSLLWKLSLNRAAGSDEIPAEHLIQGCPTRGPRKIFRRAVVSLHEYTGLLNNNN